MARYVAPEPEIAVFLHRYREAMALYGLDLWLNTKNQQFMNDSGFTKADAELVVMQLRTIDYSTGPEPDDNPERAPGEVWVFGYEFEGYNMYVKLKLKYQSYGELTPSVCMSFHPEERPLNRPHWPRRHGR